MHSLFTIKPLPSNPSQPRTPPRHPALDSRFDLLDRSIEPSCRLPSQWWILARSYLHRLWYGGCWDHHSNPSTQTKDTPFSTPTNTPKHPTHPRPFASPHGPFRSGPSRKFRRVRSNDDARTLAVVGACSRGFVFAVPALFGLPPARATALRRRPIGHQASTIQTCLSINSTNSNHNQPESVRSPSIGGSCHENAPLKEFRGPLSTSKRARLLRERARTGHSRASACEPSFPPLPWPPLAHRRRAGAPRPHRTTPPPR